tara:strand:+ start:231 stop:1256 length:1026 start_codon:yes stop_codon:yes gene_type:complete
MIKVFTVKSMLTPQNRPYVFPLLFDMHYNEQPDPRIAAHYKFTDKLEDADIFVFPIDINGPFKGGKSREVLRIIESWTKFNKPVWVYTSGDYGITLKDPKITQFRFGGFKSRFPSHTEVMPAFIQDPYGLQKIKPFYLSKPLIPKVGFVGFSSSSLKVWGKALAATVYGNLRRLLGKEPTDRQTFYPAAYRRKKYLNQLERHPEIDTVIIHRDQYRAGANSPEQRAQTTTAFFSNIFNTPYTLCVRGAGNFSVRFYEVLASGRIPILIDTDVKLPLDNHIDWSLNSVIVDTTKPLTVCLQQWHEATATTEFEAIQKRNRELWQSHLTRESYFCSIHDRLKS